jgi:hypothetical protein
MFTIFNFLKISRKFNKIEFLKDIYQQNGALIHFLTFLKIENILNHLISHSLNHVCEQFKKIIKKKGISRKMNKCVVN